MAKLAKNRWCNTLSWSYRLIHKQSGARTRSKTTASSSPFQSVQDHPVLISYELVMIKTLTTCLLNRAIWRWIAIWKRWWCPSVQCGNVLIILPFLNWSRPRLHLGDVLIIPFFYNWSRPRLIPINKLLQKVSDSRRCTRYNRLTKHSIIWCIWIISHNSAVAEVVASKTPTCNSIPLFLSMSMGGLLLISLASLTISIGDKGSKVMFLFLCMKVYVLVLPWCKASVSNSHGRPNKIEQAYIGTTSKSAVSW